MNNDNARPDDEIIPSVEVKKRLAELSKEFKATNVGFTLALDSDNSLEACQADGLGMIERLKRFIDSGYNHEKAGLDPTKYIHRKVSLEEPE